MPFWSVVFFLTVGASAPGGAGLAQRHAHLEIALPRRTELMTEGPRVRAVGVLSDREMRDMLRKGFPARLHYRVELWSAHGLVDELRGSAEWDVVVVFDPLDNTYAAARFWRDQRTPLGRSANFAEIEAAVSYPFQPAIRIPRSGRDYYYNVTLDVETLSFSDLDEVERWLRGELRPAVRGQRNPGTALTRGVRTLLARLLGGQRRHYELRSNTFRAV